MSQSTVRTEVRNGEIRVLIDYAIICEGEERLELFRRSILKMISKEDARIYSLSPQALRSELRQLILDQNRMHVTRTSV